MIKNHLKIISRNIMKHKGYSFINISGLAVGMACTILIFLWVQHELSYDLFHKNVEQIYRVNPGFAFDYHFFDETYDLMYRNEKRLGKILFYFAFLAIFISCLGLFGLASFLAERRTKEIGIRKTLGASVPGITVMLSKKFTGLVVWSNAIGWPIAYYIMKHWLQQFAYRTAIGIEIFIWGGITALSIAWLTISYQSIKAALANPVDALRYE